MVKSVSIEIKSLRLPCRVVITGAPQPASFRNGWVHYAPPQMEFLGRLGVARQERMVVQTGEEICLIRIHLDDGIMVWGHECDWEVVSKDQDTVLW